MDSGIAAHLVGMSMQKLDSRAADSLTAFGHLLESFVIAEIMKEVSWLDEPCMVGYWRTYDGLEADLIVERYDGRVLAFEVKAAQRITDKDLTGLRSLRDKLGTAFGAGVVFHTGYRATHLEDRIYTLPIDSLWTHKR
jgi:predicted AAA+ superfamily ATPase